MKRFLIILSVVLSTGAHANEVITILKDKLPRSNSMTGTLMAPTKIIRIIKDVKLGIMEVDGRNTASVVGKINVDSNSEISARLIEIIVDDLLAKGFSHNEVGSIVEIFVHSTGRGRTYTGGRRTYTGGRFIQNMEEASANMIKALFEKGFSDTDVEVIMSIVEEAQQLSSIQSGANGSTNQSPMKNGVVKFYNEKTGTGVIQTEGDKMFSPKEYQFKSRKIFYSGDNVTFIGLEEKEVTPEASMKNDNEIRENDNIKEGKKGLNAVNVKLA